jgi:hypothetical protein
MEEGLLLTRLRELMHHEDSLRIDRLTLEEGGSVGYADHQDLPVQQRQMASWADLTAFAEEKAYDFFGRSNGPLWDAHLITCPDQSGQLRAHLCGTFDHIIWDGRSHALFGEVVTSGEEVRGLRSGRHRAWVRWQRSTYADPQILDAPSIQFWHEHLGGTPPDRAVDLSFHAGAHVSPTGTAMSVNRVAPVSVDQLRRAAALSRTTPFVIFAAAVAHAVNRFGGSQDFTFRVNTAGRPPEYLDTLGYFADNMPVRLQGTELRDPLLAVEMVRRTWFGTLRHQTVPWDYLLAAFGGTGQIVTRQSAQALVNFLPWVQGADEVPPTGSYEYRSSVSTFQTAGTLWHDGTCRVECVFDVARFDPAGGNDFTDVVCESLGRIVTAYAD